MAVVVPSWAVTVTVITVAIPSPNAIVGEAVPDTTVVVTALAVTVIECALASWAVGVTVMVAVVLGTLSEYVFVAAANAGVIIPLFGTRLLKVASDAGARVTAIE